MVEKMRKQMAEKFKLKNGKTVEIRPLTPDDYDAVEKFFHSLSRQTIFTNQYPGQPKKDKKKSDQAYQDPNNYFLSAFKGKRLVAVSSLNIFKPGHPWCGRNAGFGISILEAYHGHGLGAKLMAMLEQWARGKGVHRIYGEVRHTNIRAISLYIKCGFVIEGLARETAFINGKWHHSYHIGKILD